MSAFTAEELMDLTKRWPAQWAGELSVEELGLKDDDFPRFMNTLAALSQVNAELRQIAYMPIDVPVMTAAGAGTMRVSLVRIIACLLRHKYGPLRIPWKDVEEMEGVDTLTFNCNGKGIDITLASAKGQGIIIE